MAGETISTASETIVSAEKITENLGENLEQNLESLEKILDTLIEFAVAYGFQLLGALAFLLVGLKVASFAGGKVAALAERKNLDQTLARFVGSVVKLVIVVVLVIITLGNFGISIAPLIALAGASAFGATLAIQGPLSNYGAGLSIILSRPFIIGNTISVQGVSGVVDDIKLAATVLVGEDGERITIPNKEIVGQVIVNSEESRVVETRIPVDGDQDIAKALDILRDVLKASDKIAETPKPHIGIHDFTYGGVVIGLRYWAPSTHYFAVRYSVNDAARIALQAAGIRLLPANMPLDPKALSGDEPPLG